MQSRLYVLYEHAAGYSVFSVQEFEEISMFLPTVESSVTDLSRFNSIVKLVSFSPFKTAVSALESINAISEGILPEDLAIYLNDVFSSLKKKKCQLGVSDAKLGAAISEQIQISCTHIGVVPEILRGIRHHFPKLVKGKVFCLIYFKQYLRSSYLLFTITLYLFIRVTQI